MSAIQTQNFSADKILGLGFLFHHLFYFTKYNISKLKVNLLSVHTLLFAVFL
jgi:hypothetical protein